MKLEPILVHDSVFTVTIRYDPDKLSVDLLKPCLYFEIKNDHKLMTLELKNYPTTTKPSAQQCSHAVVQN